MVRVINYGGGVNSTALIIEAMRRRIPVHLIVFSDTGSEMPETYVYMRRFDAWLSEHGMPRISVVKWIRVRGADAGKFIPLHVWCEENETVPSRAYGFSGCTSKWKQQPADKFIKGHPLVAQEHQAGRPVERWIGYDADEPHRAERMQTKNPQPELWAWKSPLVDWDMGRDECLETIASAGLPSPGKSACWMCPSSKAKDIARLADAHPHLLNRALRMEERAIKSGNLVSRNGLGGYLNWAAHVKKRLPQFAPEVLACTTDEGREPDDVPCGCYDGGED